MAEVVKTLKTPLYQRVGENLYKLFIETSARAVSVEIESGTGEGTETTDLQSVLNEMKAELDQTWVATANSVENMPEKLHDGGLLIIDPDYVEEEEEAGEDSGGDDGESEEPSEGDDEGGEGEEPEDPEEPEEPGDDDSGDPSTEDPGDDDEPGDEEPGDDTETPEEPEEPGDEGGEEDPDDTGSENPDDTGEGGGESGDVVDPGDGDGSE